MPVIDYYWAKPNHTPAPAPASIRLSDGTLRTDPTTFTETEMQDAGYTIQTSPPPSATPWETVTFDGAQWVVQSRPLEQVKRMWLNAVTARFIRARDAGTTITLNAADVRIETNHQAQQEVSELVQMLSRKGGTQRVATRSGAVFDADLAAATAMRDAVADHVSAAWTTDADLRDTINAATTVADVVLIEVEENTGWPS